ncbi:hypothetical protein [Candidimonas nitroreducens]|uniref:Uncharacterized protein n=1 Tax=Candidimonas nitroreducens TaxID=683354 RepID=A0A225M1K1_9BURK|nr:hypothetical protein [Candidimonas nitroreducens]OWT55235.1 hypothetical protein CEY11_21230 [Candidimonas nitroreducens]
MLEIMNTKIEDGYSSAAVGVKLRHTMSSSQVSEVIRIAKELYGADYVIEAAGLRNMFQQSATPNKGYMVSVDGADAPTIVHNTLRDAEYEAKRILSSIANSDRPRLVTARVLRVEKVFGIAVKCGDPVYKVVEI